MATDLYQWQRPAHQRRSGDARLSTWVLLALILSVGAHVVLWVMFGNFHMKSEDKITLTEPFRIKRSTFDATVLDDVPDTGTDTPTNTQDPSAADQVNASIEEAVAEFTKFSEEDLADFIVNAEIKMTPEVEQIENVAIDAGGGDVLETTPAAPSANDGAENDIAKVLQGLEQRSKPLDPDHPEIEIGDVLGGAEESSLADSVMLAAGGGEEVIPDGYASLDQVLGMKGQGDPGKPIWVPTDVLFEFNSAELKDDARLSLMKLGALIMKRKDDEFLLEGHTDLIGDDAYNKALSLNRATAIRNWLLEALRLDPERIKVIGHGKNKPLVLEGTVEEQAVNRRVEVTIQPIGTFSPF